MTSAERKMEISAALAAANSLSNAEDAIRKLQQTVEHQQFTIDALKQTNHILTEENEKLMTEISSMRTNFLIDNGFQDQNRKNTEYDSNTSSNDANQARTHILSIDQIADDDTTTSLYNSPQISLNNHEKYSSDTNVDTYETLITNDHDLLPMKQGWVKKRSENMFKYNKRWIILYPSMLLYYKSNPIQLPAKESTINHPQGTIFLRNYHLYVRRDVKKLDFTFVAHQSSINIGLGVENIEIRFKCSSIRELNEWVHSIRSSIINSESGFIKYRNDFMYNSLTNDITDDVKYEANINNNMERNMMNNDVMQDTSEIKIFGVQDLHQLLNELSQMKDNLGVEKRNANEYRFSMKKMESELEINRAQLECVNRVSEKQIQDLNAHIIAREEKLIVLAREISKLRNSNMSKEQNYNNVKNEIMEFKEHEENIMFNIGSMVEWNHTLQECTIQRLGALHPNYNIRQLTNECNRICMQLVKKSFDICTKNKHCSEVIKDMLRNYSELVQMHLKSIVGYCNLLQNHDGVVRDMKMFKENFHQQLEQFQNKENVQSELEDEALIMASMAVSPF